MPWGDGVSRGVKYVAASYRIGISAILLVKVFRVTVSSDRTDYVATNDLSQNSTDVVQVCKYGRKIEEFHARIKAVN
jgi:hypothetical protein